MPKGVYRKTEEHRKKISEWMKGNTHGKTNKGRISSLELRQRLSESHKGLPNPNKGKPMLWMQGEKNPKWKGGITDKIIKIRNSLEYRLWREAIFKRDDFTCLWCGMRGGKLNADHIQTFADYPELRFAIDNGRTLCKDCHLKRHMRSK